MSLSNSNLLLIAPLNEGAVVALRQANSLKLPVNTVIVDEQYSDVGGNERQFKTVEAALTYIRSQGGVWRLIAGLNRPVPSGEDYYALLAEGIIYDSAFDLWKLYILTGGDLSESEMLYHISDSKLNIDVRA